MRIQNRRFAPFKPQPSSGMLNRRMTYGVIAVCLAGGILGAESLSGGSNQGLTLANTSSSTATSSSVSDEPTAASREQEASEASRWPLIYSTDFEKGAADWTPTEEQTWEVREEAGGGHAFHQHQKQASYQPPVRSPHHIAWLNDIELTSFQLDVRVRSTHPDYGHRDCCLFFGRQDASHFYYVHLGKEMDDAANQIFIVNGVPRAKISTKTSNGTPWDEEWHQVRIIRDAESGSIEVFFDDMTDPVMTANDKTFVWGSLGLGSFDDTSAWDDVKLYGVRRE